MNNLDAFLAMIGTSEGSRKIPDSDDGYRALVGGTTFVSYDDHPRVVVDLGNGRKSTAAGRYQILERYYDAYKVSLHLPDFSPGCQDAIATQMIRESRALDDVDAGRFDVAIEKVAHLWASMPNAGYSQRENSLADLRAAYMASGGLLA